MKDYAIVRVFSFYPQPSVVCHRTMEEANEHPVSVCYLKPAVDLLQHCFKTSTFGYQSPYTIRLPILIGSSRHTLYCLASYVSLCASAQRPWHSYATNTNTLSLIHHYVQVQNQLICSSHKTGHCYAHNHFDVPQVVIFHVHTSKNPLFKKVP